MRYRRGLKLTQDEKPGDHILRKRGVVAHLMASNARYRGFPLLSLSVWIDPAINTNQLAIFYDSYSSNPLGYITWAFLAPDVEQRWLNDPKVLLHESEWNEGGNLWFMDFLTMPGYCEDIIEFIEQNMFVGYSQAFSLRRNDDGTVRKVSRWKRRRNEPTPAQSLSF